MDFDACAAKLGIEPLKPIVAGHKFLLKRQAALQKALRLAQDQREFLDVISSEYALMSEGVMHADSTKSFFSHLNSLGENDEQEN